MRVLRILAILILTVELNGRCAPAGAQDTGATAAQPAAGATPLSVGDIGTQASEVAAELRAMHDATAEGAAGEELETQVFTFRQRVSDLWTQTDHLLRGTLRRAPLTAIASSWRTLRIELVGLQRQVDGYAQRDEADLQALERLRETWSWTLDRARRVEAPDTSMARIGAMLDSIGATRVQVERHRTRLLALQDSVARSLADVDAAAVRVADARHQLLAHVFTEAHPPIWRIAQHSAAPDAEAEHVDLLSTQFAAQIGSMRIYVQAHRPGIVLAVLLLLALAVAMYWARARSATDVAGGTPLPESVARIYRAPLATALIFAVVCTRPLRPDPPLAIQQITLLILLWGTLVLLRPLLDRRLAPTLYALAAILVVDIGRQRLLATPAAEQVVLLLETSAASVLLLLGAGQLRTAEGPLVRELPWLRAAGSALLRLAALATMAAAIAAALGYLNLADLVGSGSLFVVFISIGLLSVRVAVAGVIGLALLKSPLARLHTVQRGGARIERAIGRALDLALVAFWILMTLQVFEVQAPVAAALQSALGASLYIGDLNVPIGRIFNFAAVVVGAWIISRVVVFALEEDVYPRLQLPRGVPYALSSLIRYGLLLLGFFLALGTVGLDLTKVTILVSAFGLGIGFGLQQIVNNFVSGLILLFERPVQVGDSVQLADLIGEVTRIGIRSSTIRTLEGAEVVVPNSSVLEEKVTNWTLSDRKRRVDLSVGVTYGTDAARMIALLVDVARGIPAVVDDPPPEAFFIGFGDSSLDFQIRVWTVQPKWARLRSDLAVAVQRALADAGIEVPFPQRDLHIRSDRSGPPPPGQDKP